MGIFIKCSPFGGWGAYHQMKSLLITGTPDTPFVCLDIDKKRFEIGGKSIPEDADTFYAGIIKWWKEYAKNPLKETILQIKLEYINTVSTRKILEIFAVLEKIKNAGVIWHIHAEDDQEDILPYFDFVKIPYKIQVYK